MLAVVFVPADDWFLFEYYEAAFEPTRWATVCSRSEGFAKLEWVLNKRLRGSGGERQVTDDPRRSTKLAAGVVCH